MSSFFCLAVLGVTATAQKRDMDPEIKNYKLSMDKIKSFDTVLHRLYDASKSDPSLKSAVTASNSKKTIGEAVSQVESIPKLMAVIKSAGLTARDFCLIPMGVMAAGGAYMIQTQYKKDPSSLATPENLAFYAANKEEIEKITSTWGGPDQK